MSSKPKPYEPSFMVKIHNFLWPEGTYGEILPPDSAIIAENKDAIRKAQEVVKRQMARKQAEKEQA